MKRILVLALVFGFMSMLNAQWVSPGNGTTYTLSDLVETGCVLYDNANSTYSINADLTISATDKLYIKWNDTPASSALYFNENDLILTIKGSIVVEGPEHLYYLGMPVYAHHGRIRFEDASDPSHFDHCLFGLFSGIDIFNSEVIFENCTFSEIDTYHQSSAVKCMNCDPIFTNCRFSDNEGAAINTPVNGHSSPQIINCQFTNNVTANTNHPQINLGSGNTDTIRIVNSTIEGNGHDKSGGITIADQEETGETKILLKDNIIKNNRYGYNQQGINLSSIIIGNEFLDNNIETNPMTGGSGISVYGTNENNKAVLRNNIITGNLWGITVINAANIDLGTEDDWGNNQIHDNGNSGVVYDLYNNTANEITAVGNNWGTTDENEVEDHIVHQNDNPELGLVIYIPFIGYEGINAFNTAHFEVSPNPVSHGWFTLKLENAMPSEVVIYNLNGQIMTSQNIENEVNIINIERLVSGIYFVEVCNENGKTMKKIVIR